VVSTLNREHNIAISIIDMFQYPTVKRLAAHIDSVAKPDGLTQARSRAQRQRRALTAGIQWRAKWPGTAKESA
jgi:hypothetical protein